MLFVAVAESGGLAGASRATGTPVPTLSRRMGDLERELGRHLFQRGKRGYALTSDGRAFLEEVSPLRAAVLAFRARSRRDGPARVKITCGALTARFLAQNIAEIWSPGDAWVPEFLTSSATLDIARREADIGIRNRRPEQSWLAGQRTARLTYAVYARTEQTQGFVALAEDARTVPSERWLRAHYGQDIVTTTHDKRTALDLALAGIGRIVLPSFVGEPEPDLCRVSPEIDDLAHDEWLVSHHEGRHDPPVRAALDALSTLLSAPNRR